jgi:hypothetical protein
MSALKLTGLMVGMHFRPPAKAVLEALPAGTLLWLRREPSNPYDVNAVQVLLPGFEEGDKWGDLRKGLEATGQWGEEMFTNPLHLAYVDSTKTGMAKIFSEAILEQAAEQELDPASAENCMVEGELSFSLEGKPQVVTSLENFLFEEEDGLEVEDEDELPAHAIEDGEHETNWGDK